MKKIHSLLVIKYQEEKNKKTKQEIKTSRWIDDRQIDIKEKELKLTDISFVKS